MTASACGLLQDSVFRLRVDRVEGGDFVWVITEVGQSTEETELASSLLKYGTARAALAEGAKVLEQRGDV
jgi:hypothetical protein